MTTLYERTGLPEGIGDAARRQEQRWDDLGGLARRDPMVDGTLDRLERADRWYENLGDATGIPTYHDFWETLRGEADALEPWIEKSKPPLPPPPEPQEETDPPPEDDEDDEDDEGSDWWWIFGVVAGGILIYRKLENWDVSQPFDFDFDIPAWEIDGIPWTVERTRIPGPQFAARVADPLLHGGSALPGPGSKDVLIGGRGALTIDHAVLACPMPTAFGLPHLPHVGRTAWTTTNERSVLVNGQPLLRAGDWIMETFGGPNPIISGEPTVLAGPPGAPCVVRETKVLGLDELIPGAERIGWTGGKVSVKGTLSWNGLEMAKTLGLGALSRAGPWGYALAKLLADKVEGPKIDVEAEASVDWFVDLFAEHDRDGDGVVDRIIEGRVTGTSTAKGKTTVELDPTNPTKVRKEEEGELEFETEFNRPEVQGRKPGEPRKPWKDEEK